MHEFEITENGTALVIIYDVEPADLTEFGGPEHGYLSDCLFQEIDIASGSLIFEWRMSHHVPLNSSYEAIRGMGWDPTNAYDAFHMNSVDKDRAGNYLVSVRHTHSIISIDGNTGDILWTLGGKMNDFVDASGDRATDFAWQHDARWQDDHTMTLLDNTAEWFLDEATQSRAMTLDIDIPNRIASVSASYFHPEGIRATSQGNVQVLTESRNVFVAWGHCAAFTEFSPDGEVLCDTHFGPANWFQLGQAVSYRITKGSWIGNPRTRPAGVVHGSSVFVSWNGATEVFAWRLELWNGVDKRDMEFEPFRVVLKESFETEIGLPSKLPNVYFRVVALNDQDDILGVTETLGRQLNWNLRDVIRRYSAGVPAGVVASIIMILCCLLLAIYWVLRRYAISNLRSRPYRPIPRDASGYSTEDEQSLSPVSRSSMHLLPTFPQPS